MVITFATTDKTVRLASQFYRIEDRESGLTGVIAIDSLARGPAAGGCRLWNYDTTSSLHSDAVRLARGMTFKNAMAGLPFGGGKAVLQTPQGDFDRAKLFAAFGDAVQALQGNYVTAEDVGTTIADMEAVRRRTQYVAGLSHNPGRAGGDPSPWTARGVFQAMTVAAHFTFGADLSRLRVAVQGAGNVGSQLCMLLASAGAQVTVCDIDAQRSKRLAQIEGVVAVAPEALAGVNVDIFAPCALGGALNDVSVAALRAKLVCGGANNQLATDAVMTQLMDRGICYVPDYVANAGGIINVSAEYLGETTAEVTQRVDLIGPRVLTILSRAQAERRSPAMVADEMVGELLAPSRVLVA